MQELTNLKGIKFGSFHKLTPNARREALNGLLFISPWLIGFIAFTLIPMIATLGFSFMNLKLTNAASNPLRFIGLLNYENLFRTAQVWRSLWITIRFGFIALPVGIILPLALALLMNTKSLKGQNLFRTLFYMPYIIPFVASIFVWGGMLNPETGWINKALEAMGVQNPPGWANDVNWVYPAYVIMGVWGIGNSMLIMLAGLQGVPTDLYDAAKVDGAGWWDTLFNVTMPMISPVIFYQLVLGIVGVFQYFLAPLVINQGTGRPGGATMFYNLYLYKVFFTNQDMGFGATMAWLLFVVILLVTIILFATAKYWVYYASESR